MRVVSEPPPSPSAAAAAAAAAVTSGPYRTVRPLARHVYSTTVP